MIIKSKLAPVALAMLLGMAVAVSGCAGNEKKPKVKAAVSEEKIVKIGLITSLTGGVKASGESTLNAFNLAIEQAAGRAGDYKIETVVADDRNDDIEAVNVASKLISQDKVNCIVGPLTSITSIPVGELCNKSKIPMITNTATDPRVTVDNGKRKEYVFRACFIDPFQGKVAAKFALDNLQKKTAAVLYDQGNDYTIELSNTFKESFTAGGGAITDFIAYSRTDVDFSTVLSNIANKNPDILYLPDYYQRAVLIGSQARDKGIKAVFLGGDRWDFADIGNAAMAGSYFTNHFSIEDRRPEVQKFLNDYKVKYGTAPDLRAVLGYDAANIMLSAIKAANNSNPDNIRKALEQIKDFAAVSGSITIDRNGNPIKPAVVLQVKPDKTYAYVTTVNP
jgi:branched-chain amino acid transport system substrate-binding protein